MHLPCVCRSGYRRVFGRIGSSPAPNPPYRNVDAALREKPDARPRDAGMHDSGPLRRTQVIDICHIGARCEAFVERDMAGFFQRRRRDEASRLDSALLTKDGGKEVPEDVCRKTSSSHDEQRLILLAHSMGGQGFANGLASRLAPYERDVPTRERGFWVLSSSLQRSRVGGRLAGTHSAGVCLGDGASEDSGLLPSDRAGGGSVWGKGGRTGAGPACYVGRGRGCRCPARDLKHEEAGETKAQIELPRAHSLGYWSRRGVTRHQSMPLQISILPSSCPTGVPLTLHSLLSYSSSQAHVTLLHRHCSQGPRILSASAFALSDTPHRRAPRSMFRTYVAYTATLHPAQCNRNPFTYTRGFFFIRARTVLSQRP
ncbi:hypothetical protein C8Q70DRAFT_740428 [Cubamyces menziesii]|nr:hypothetical protein C8Q70DRAFT_740428 [Cubamyces menziesii]